MLENRPPNMRVQRTRSSPSALRSPLTRHPLGGRWLCVALAAFAVSCATGKPSATSMSVRGCDPAPNGAAHLRFEVNWPRCEGLLEITAFRPNDPESPHFGISVG